MAGSVRNQNSARGNNATINTANVTVGAWIRAGATSYTTGPRYQYLIEVGIPARVYAYQIFTDTNDDQLKFYSDETGEVTILSSSSVAWIYCRLVKNGTTVTLEYRTEFSSTWNTVTTFTVSATNVTWHAFFDTWFADGLCVDGYLRSAGIWEAVLTQAESLTESNSPTAVRTTNLRGYYAGGATPDAATWGTSTPSGTNLTQSGTAVADADDPIPSGGATSIAAAVAGTGTVTAALSVNKRLTAAVVGTGVVSATARAMRRLTAAVAGTGTVTATAIRRTPIAAAVVGSGTVTAAARANRRIAATVGGTSSVVAGLRVSPALSAAVAGTGLVTAALRVSKPIVAAVAGGGTVTANLRVNRRLAAAVLGVGTVTANVSTTAGSQIAAGVVGGGTVTAVLRVNKRLIASVAGVGTVDATAKRRTPIAAAVGGTSSVVADLTATNGFVATVGGTGTVAAALTVRRSLAANVVGSGTVTATARALRRLAAEVIGTSVVNADATVAGDTPQQLTATVGGTSLTIAFLSVRKRLAAVVAGVSSVLANIRRPGETVATSFVVRPRALIYTVRPTAPVYRVRYNMDRFDDFDPQTRDWLEWDLSRYVAARGVAIVSATVTQLDPEGAALAVPTVVTDAAVVTGTVARALVTNVTATPGTLARLRCRFVFADGRVGNTIGVLPIRHT
jgi:hypothetical protein